MSAESQNGHSALGSLLVERLVDPGLASPSPSSPLAVIDGGPLAPSADRQDFLLGLHR